MTDLDKFSSADVLSLDFETDENKKMEMFSVGCKSGRKTLSAAFGRERFPEFWEKNKDKKLIFHNAKFDLGVIKREGYDHHLTNFEDTIIMAHLLDETQRKALKELRVSALGKPERATWDEVDKSDKQAYMEYAAADAEDTLDLYHLFKDSIVSEELETVYNLEKQVIFPVIDMEYYGSKIDDKLIHRQEKFLSKKIDEIYETIKTTTGFEVNLKSTKQLQELFFKVLKYPARNEWRTKTGISTKESVLEYIAGDRRYPEAQDVATKMMTHRKYSKILSAFVSGLIERMDESGYIFPSFNSLGTVTGRFSGSDPNLQQIPREEFVKGNMDTHIRSLFICEPDEYIITADYSQIELRLMAELSHDKNMCQAFRDGADIHQMTADMLGCSRQDAKTLNFGVGYGMGAGAFAATTGLSFDQAQDYIYQFWTRYSGLEDFFQRMVKETQRLGYVRTISGRKRRFYGQYDDSSMRQTMNTVIQGGAADLIKTAMIKAYRELDHKRSRFLMQVHDELSIAAKREYAEESKEILKYCMEHAIKASIPLLAEPKIGVRWSDNKG